MKKSFIYINYCTVAFLMCMAVIIQSCKKNETGIKAAPVVERVRTLSKNDTTYTAIRVTLDSTRYANVYSKSPLDKNVTMGALNTQYAIVGQNLLSTTSITLNGVSLFFNPAFVTENYIIFLLDASVPYGPDQKNILTVTTKYGSTDYKFSVQQPPPVITSVNPLLGPAGNTVTITGTILQNLVSVKFGTLPAEVVGTPTSTSITVKIPTGVTQSNLVVTTIGGTATSANTFFVFKKLLYDDAWTSGMTSYGGWGGTGDIANTAVAVRGTKSIVFNYVGYDCPLQMAYTGPTIALNTVTALKLSIYGGPGSAGKKVKLEFNGDATQGATLTLTEGSWTDYVVPISSITTTQTTFTKLWIVESSGAKESIYIDEIGFL
jgi:hypothetical protein